MVVLWRIAEGSFRLIYFYRIMKNKVKLRFGQMNMKLSEIIQQKHGIDYSNEISTLIFDEDILAKKKRLTKKDHEMLTLAIQIIRLGEI